MPELGSYGFVRGARGNSRPYRERGRPTVKVTRLTQSDRKRALNNIVLCYYDGSFCVQLRCAVLGGY